MSRSIRFPSLRFAFLSFVIGFAVTKLLAVDLPLETRGFYPVEGGETIHEDIDLFVASFDDSTFSANNASDLVILGSVSTLAYLDNDEDDDEDDTLLYVAYYDGFQSASGTRLDEGRIMFETPYDFKGLTSAGAVGFIRKTGGWVKKGTVDESFVYRMTGTISYQSLQKKRDVSLEMQSDNDGVPFTIRGTSTSEVLSSDSVLVALWVASEDSDIHYSFNATSYSRNGNTYTGFTRRIDESLPDDWMSMYLLTRIVDVNDADGDGIPDLSDIGAEQVLGVLAANSVDVGNGQIWSNDLNTYVSLDPHELWLYGENLGWFYLPDQNDTGKIKLYIPDDNLGWLWTNADISPCYIRESDGGKIYFELVDGQVWYYDYTLESWFQPSY